MTRKYGKLLGVLLSLAMLISLLPGLSPAALAESGPVSYALWVGGRQVTSENAADLFGDGTVRFTPAEGEDPAVLELNNYHYSGEGFCADVSGPEEDPNWISVVLYYREETPLEVRLTGENVLEQTSERAVRLAAAIFSSREGEFSLTLIGTDDTASLTAAADKAEQYSGAIQSNNGLVIQNLRLEARGGEAGKESDGLFAVNEITITDSAVRAVSGVGKTSSAVVCYDALTVADSEVYAEGGEGENSYGLCNYDDAAITGSTVEARACGINYGYAIQCAGALAIDDSEVLADASAERENAYVRDGIFVGQTLTIRGSGVTALSGPAEWSTGMESYYEDVEIDASRIEARSGAATVASMSLCAMNLTISGTCDITAVAGNAPTEGDTFSCGLNVDEDIRIGGAETVVYASGGEGVQSYGFSANGSITIADEVASVTARGTTRAVYGSVANAIEGTGWSDYEGVGAIERIPVNGDGAEHDYRNLRFGEAREWFSDAVRWAVATGVMDAESEETFTAGEDCSRGETLLALWRALGSPEPGSAESPFADLSPEDECYPAVLWAYETGVTTGVDATHFAPEGTATRAQALTFLFRAAGSPGSAGSENPFEDVQEGDWFCESVLWAVALGVTNGTDATHFSPGLTLTRAHVATLLFRMFSGE